ncbi:pyrroline-5-carboxylate reductase [Poseidonocella pacifica]|uniref:Pyrroline-5-carboxylate reductase n=1 Tax=Poseidonocella pacifica TaxID=871651 RepID=A0A1I0X7A1_9RHOB|nr:pyrroline-5-carboxylate reductase [Poseidonocella pacifica]SFA96734.1 pyrroline-5-carboxylate reductase [Poseidonocella pacifica]
MEFEDVARRGLVLIGCGKMGSAMLRGWIDGGVPPEAVWVRDPSPAPWLSEAGIRVNAPLPETPAVVLIAVKPQMMTEALPDLAAMGGGATLFISVAAGTSLATFERHLGSKAPIIRAMPNTPAAIGQGITAMIGNDRAGEGHLDLAEKLLRAIGEVVRLEAEEQMDAVTGLSGSGPAYVFHMIECMTAAGVAQGLSEELALELAKITVAGAGALARSAEESPAILRENVTSPNGTTQAGLKQLMNKENGLPPLMIRTIGAAAERSRELSRG